MEHRADVAGWHREKRSRVQVLAKTQVEIHVETATAAEKKGMKTRRPRVGSPGPWMALFALLAGGAGGGMVICFGSDGHVAVEAAKSGTCGESRCSSSPQDTRFSPDGLSVSTSCCCGACIDLPVSARTLDRRFVPAQDQHKRIRHPADLPRSVVEPSGFRLAKFRSTSPSLSGDAAILSLRNVILLI